MATSLAYGGAELLQIADSVAREKGIQRESVLDAMAQAIQIAGRRKYGHDHNILAEIDNKSGEIKLFRVRDVVETVEEDVLQISLKDAKKINAELEVGSVIKDPLPPIDFGRIAAQTAKQVIVQKVRDAERDKQFEEFKGRVGEVINGLVKRVEFGNVTVDLGRGEAVLRREESIPRETFRQGDRIRAYIYDVRRERTGPQIFLSRAHPQFMAKLFAQEVPEIYDGVIQIRAVARDPGSRAKIAVTSRDSNIDPVGSCVGVRGSRVQAVVNELQGEKIDIIPWTNDTASFIVSALQPAEVAKVVIDEDRHRIEVVVPEEQLSLAIGRRGQNVRLASQLSGWEIDIMTESEESTRRTEEFNTLTALFIEALNVEDVIAQLLVTEGFSSVEDIAYTSIPELARIEGFDEDVATELNGRANTYLEEQLVKLQEKLENLGVEQDLVDVPGLTMELLVALAENGIKTRDDLAELASDELLDLKPAGTELSRDEANEIIMAARAHWFDGEEQA
ncbi:MAG: transcription termination/antitermination protein NusA [Alphaproteobacteria bacterium]|nr:transcription termination/antitermination protein NusA [Alphaproteobacteria bacterium]